MYLGPSLSVKYCSLNASQMDIGEYCASTSDVITSQGFGNNFAS